MINKLSYKKILGLVVCLTISMPLFASENRFDIRVSPVLLFVKVVDAEVNIKISDHFTVAPMGTYWGASNLLDSGNDKFSLTNFGARLYWHPSGVFKDGFYVSPFYKYWKLTATTVNSFGNSATGSENISQVGATAGYLWQWDNFNTNIGLGYSVLNLGDITVKDNLGNQTTVSSFSSVKGGVAADLSIGYAF